jgi:transposase InsO family protein
VREKVATCPKLHFLDEKLPLFLHTDASDYGIGAYLFQKTPEGKELPIAFLSKSLTAERLRWSVPEKEAYAIVYAFQKLEYVLRDMHFTLRTDHKNLLYINEDGSAKVRRWKLAIQEYNFDIEHIAGEENVAADAFSRLCERHPDLGAAILNNFDGPIPAPIKRTIRSVHNSTSGHNGVDKTLSKLEAKGVAPWKEMREHVTRYIKECPICQKLDYRAVKNHTTPFTVHSNAPMEVISADTIGPLPEDEFGNKFILVVIDQFTRFVELYAVKDQTAKYAAQALLSHIGRYGAPQALQSDKGSQFVNETIQELLKLVGSEHKTTLPDSKEENGIVERANKEVMRHLRAILLEMQTTNEWSVYLPLVQRIMNASEHSSIGMSPAQLLFGNAVTLDKGIFLPHAVGYVNTEESETSFAEWADKMRIKQAELIELARKNQLATDGLKQATASANRTEFPVNSYVLVKYRDRPPTKFHSNWRGPMRVVDFKKSHYTLQDLVTGKNKSFHLTQLKPFKFDEMDIDPAAIARAEQQEFLVENILAHRKTPGSNKRTDFEFLVKWRGYDEADNTWEPWEFVRDNDKLLVYLYQNRLKQFLTKEQKLEAEQLIQHV